MSRKRKCPADSLMRLVQRRVAHFWGQRHIVTPRLADWIHGDGKQVIYFTPLATRPQHYVVRIDSRVDLDSDAFRGHVLEGIYEALEDQFGRHRDEYEHDNGRTYVKHNGWPALDDDYGSAWGTLAMLKRTNRRPESEIRAEITRTWKRRRSPLNAQALPPKDGSSA